MFVILAAKCRLGFKAAVEIECIPAVRLVEINTAPLGRIPA
jgi:hypothetical protein